MFGNRVTEFQKFADGIQGYILSIDATSIRLKSVVSIQAEDNGTTGNPISAQTSLVVLQSYINNTDFVNSLAYCYESDILYIYFNATAYPYITTTRFVVFGKRFAFPITSLEDEIDVKESDLELFSNYAIREAAQIQAKKVPPEIIRNIQILEEQMANISEESEEETITNIEVSTIQTTVNITSSNYRVNVNLSGTKNGINTIFNLPTTPIVNTEMIFWNGIKQIRNSDYSISDAQITCLTFIPESGDYLDSTYFEV